MAGKGTIPKGEKITIDHGKLVVPDHPIVAFIEGDRIVAGLEKTIQSKVVTYDLARG